MERTRLFALALVSFVATPAAAQTHEPLHIRPSHVNLSSEQPAWASTADGDFMTGVVHDGPARIGTFELIGDGLTSTLARVSPGGTLRGSVTLLEQPSGAEAHIVHSLLALPDGRVVTADDRGPLSISTPVLTMRDANGSPLWTLQPETDQFAMLEPMLGSDGDLLVVIHHYATEVPSRVAIPGDAGYTITRREGTLGVMRVDAQTGRVRASRFLGAGTTVHLWSDDSLVVVDAGKTITLWSANGRRGRVFPMTPIADEIFDDEHALLADDLLLTVRMPVRTVAQLAGGGHTIEWSPARLEAYDLTTGDVRFTYELPPGDRVRLTEGDGMAWIAIDHGRVRRTPAGGSFDRKLARQVRVLSVDARGQVAAQGDFSIPGAALLETELLATSRGLFAHGAAVPLEGAGEPSFFLMHVPLAPETVELHASSSAAANSVAVGSQLEARVIRGLGDLVPDAW